MGAPENTAKQNQTDETGEAKLNIIYTRQEAIKIKCNLDKTGKPMEAEHREMRQRTRDTTGETEGKQRRGRWRKSMVTRPGQTGHKRGNNK